MPRRTALARGTSASAAGEEARRAELAEQSRAARPAGLFTSSPSTRSWVPPQQFYARDALVVAPELLGKLLVRGPVTLRITEVEAYPPGDTASHCRAGRTARTATMFGPPGHAYVYLCYGIHSMLNVVTNADGQGAAVLIRACEVVSGEAIVRQRRGGIVGPASLAGPGKVGAALGLDSSWSGHPLFEEGGLTLVDGSEPPSIRVGKRIGIDYAEPRDRRALWRFAASDTLAVSHSRALR